MWSDVPVIARLLVDLAGHTGGPGADGPSPEAPGPAGRDRWVLRLDPEARQALSDGPRKVV